MRRGCQLMRDALQVVDGEMPRIGFGTGSLRGEGASEVILGALREGFRHIDTASSYRNNREISSALLTFVAENPSLSRKDFYITDKLQTRECVGKKDVVSIIARRCRQLLAAPFPEQSDQYLDMMLVHWPGMPRAKTEEQAQNRQSAWGRMLTAKNEGLVRAIGVSNFTISNIEQMTESGLSPPAVNQCEAHVFFINETLRSFQRERSIPFVCYAPLANGGLLAAVRDEVTGLDVLVQDIVMSWPQNKLYPCTPEGCAVWVALLFLLTAADKPAVIPSSSSIDHIRSLSTFAQLYSDGLLSLTEEHRSKLESMALLQQWNSKRCWDPECIDEGLTSSLT